MAKLPPPHGGIHMATHRPAHNTPIHMDLVLFYTKSYKKSMWIGVLWAGLWVAMWIAHVGGAILPWPARKVTEKGAPYSGTVKAKGL